MTPEVGWPLLIYVFGCSCQKNTFQLHNRPKTWWRQYISSFFDTISRYPCLTKWPLFLPTTWKCRHFFQKCSKLNQTKSPKSPGLWPGPILSSGTFYPGAGHMPPPRANRVKGVHAVMSYNFILKLYPFSQLGGFEWTWYLELGCPEPYPWAYFTSASW